MHISTYQLRMYIQICYITPHIPNAVNLLCHGLVYSEVNPIVNEWVARIIIPGGFLVGLTSLQATAVKIGDGFCLSLPYDHPARTCFCPTLLEKPYEFDGLKKNVPNLTAKFGISFSFGKKHISYRWFAWDPHTVSVWRFQLSTYQAAGMSPNLATNMYI